MMLESDFIANNDRIDLKNQINNTVIDNCQTSELVVLITNNYIYKPIDSSKIIQYINTINTPVNDTYVSLITLGNGYTVLIEPICLKHLDLLIKYISYLYLINPSSLFNCNISELIDQIKNHKTTSDKINQFSNISIVNLAN